MFDIELTSQQAKSTDAPQQSNASEAGDGGEPREAGGAGEGGEAVRSEDVKPKDKDEKVDDATQKRQATAEPSTQGN
jgi:hypothetical protein